MTKPQQGFTLLEVLLVMMIFALLSLMSAQVFTAIVKNQAIIQTKANSMAQIQRALRLMERDMAQAIIRSTNEHRQQTPTDFIVEPHHTEQGRRDELELVRHHWVNPGAQLARSSLERVRYRLYHDQLQRLSYPDLAASRESARVIVLLPAVSQLHLQFWQAGRWQENWYSTSTLPQAIQVSLVLPGRGRLQRVILLEGDGGDR